MIYRNNSADTLLPSTRGGAMTEVKKGSSVALPSINPYISRLGLKRTTQGIPHTDLAQTDPLTIIVKNLFVQNGYPANADDAAAFSGAVTASTSYTAFGNISWTDANGSWDADFSVTGTGTHGSGATFVVENVGGAATKPQAAGSSVDPKQGTLTLNFSTVAADSIGTVHLLYEPILISNASVFQDVDDRIVGAPETVKKAAYVQSGDVGTTDYVTGSAGQIKSEHEFALGSRIGDPCKATVYYYRDSANPTKPTETKVYSDLVTSGDLA